MALRLSRRLDWSAPSNELSRLALERRQLGDELLDLSCTNPTRVELGLPLAAACEALAKVSLNGYDPEPRGSLVAREALAYWLRATEGATAPTAGRLLLSASTSEAYGWLFQVLCDPGDQILAPEPGYPLIPQLTALQGVECESYPLHWDARSGRWRLDPDEWSVSPRCRALVVVAPGNPTGAYPCTAEWSAIAHFCRARRLVLIVDEVFSRADFASPSAAQPDWDALGVPVVRLAGLSKYLGAPQWKLAWLALHGPAAEIAHLVAALEVAADAVLNLAGPIQAALPALLAQVEPTASRIRERLVANHMELLRQVAARGLRLLSEPRGWQAVLQLDGLAEESFAAALLRDHGVLLHPGYYYDFVEEGCLVLSLLSPPPVFRAGLARLLSQL
jgi:aspartate/methionine/tyrosine aminotransferase